MNEPQQPSFPDIPPPVAADQILVPAESVVAGSTSAWLRRLLACNPFYLVSAALLLYGFHRVSLDPAFSHRETAQLIFNFSSLQIYELLLALTAVMLARRQVWYDSTLLIGLENLLVLVPFILVSQAALLDKTMLWVLCLGAGAMVFARFGGLKRCLAELNFPVRALAVGMVTLVVNIVLPIAYATLHENKIGTKPTWGAAYYFNECSWLFLLPGICALANFLPAPLQAGPLLPQSGWMPWGWFLLWLAGTGCNLYSLGYVYDFDLSRQFVAPVICVLLWTVQRRTAGLLPGMTPFWRRVLLILPLPASVLAATVPVNPVFPALAALNAATYAGIYFGRRENKLALHLSFASIAFLIGGLPESWGGQAMPELGPIKWISAGVAGYFLLWAAISSKLRSGIFSAIASGVLVVLFSGAPPAAIHWAAQTALVMLLLHSLRWQDQVQLSARAVRALAGLAWVIHSWLWMHLGGAAWMACAMATPVLCAQLIFRWVRGVWGPPVLSVAAVAVLSCGPGNGAAVRLTGMPTGVLVVVASFIFFGLGTVAALTKRRWNRAV